MIGMTVVGAWKIERLVNADALTIKEYADIMANDMIRAAAKYKNELDTSRESQIVTVSRNEDSVSSISQHERCIGTHTKVILKKVNKFAVYGVVEFILKNQRQQ